MPTKGEQAWMKEKKNRIDRDKHLRKPRPLNCLNKNAWSLDSGEKLKIKSSKYWRDGDNL